MHINNSDAVYVIFPDLMNYEHKIIAMMDIVEYNHVPLFAFRILNNELLNKVGRE
jgi:hypothetical protein